MKKNKLTRNIIIAVVIFCLLYIFLAFQTLSSELHLTPEWTVNIEDTTNTTTGQEAIPYRLGQSIGYFTEDGKVLSRTPYPFKAAISDSFYTTYGSDNKSADFFTPSGDLAGTINENGFPFFTKDHLFVFLPGGNAFASCNQDGSTAWRFESYATITSFASSEGGVVAGLADGTIVSFNHDGLQTQKFAPGGSDVEVILGADISVDGKTVACVSGQNKQRFVVVQKTDDGHSKVIFHEYLEKDFNSQVLVKFSEDGKTVYYNYNGGLGIVNLEKLYSKHVPLEGTIVQIEESSNPFLVSVLSKNNGTYSVTVIEPEDHPVANFSFQAKCAFIQTRGDKLFIGRDEKISCLKLSRK